MYAIDLWGCGYSTREVMDWGYGCFARQIVEFMDALDIERATLVGQSMGGGTAIKVASEHPERVRKLVLVGSAGLPAKLPLLGRLYALPGVGEAVMGIPTNAVRLSNLRRYWFADPKNVSREYRIEVTRFHKVAGTARSEMTMLRSDFYGSLPDEIAELARIGTPALLVWGRQDRAVPLERGEALHAALPGSALEVIDAAGHAVNAEQSGSFNSAVLKFVG